MSKYTPEIIVEICGYLESGLNQKDAQTLAGISKSTFHEWEAKHSDFSDAISKARVKNKKFHLDVISNSKSWQASTWYLERVYSSEFASKKEEVKQPITIVWPEDKIPKKVG
jgi:hypothetical protein